MKIQHRNLDDVCIIDIEGDLKGEDRVEPNLHDYIKRLLNEEKKKFIMNFEKVNFINSHGFGEILSSFISINKCHGIMKISCLSKRLRLIFDFDIIRIGDIIPIYDNEQSAILSFEK